MDMSGILKNIVPITMFNKGKASQLFAQVKNGKSLVVVKNNAPVAVIVSPHEYELLRGLSKECQKCIATNCSIGSSKRAQQFISDLCDWDEIGENNG